MDSIVAAGLIAGGTGVFTLLVNEIFQRLRRKDEIKERFFYELYSRRIACHERLLRIAAEYSPHFVPAGRLGLYCRKVNEFTKAAQSEIVACGVFADKEVLAAADDLKEVVQSVFDSLLKSGRLNGPEEQLLEFDGTINRAAEIAVAYNFLLKTAREAAGIQAMETYLERIEKLHKRAVKAKT